jgi:hypothetical protein
MSLEIQSLHCTELSKNASMEAVRHWGKVSAIWGHRWSAEPWGTNRELSGNSIPPFHMYGRISMFHTLTLGDDQSLVKQMTNGHSSLVL